MIICAGEHPVGSVAGNLNDHVEGAIDNVGIIAGSAFQDVVAGATIQMIVSGQANQLVIAAQAVQRIGTGIPSNALTHTVAHEPEGGRENFRSEDALNVRKRAQLIMGGNKSGVESWPQTG